MVAGQKYVRRKDRILCGCINLNDVETLAQIWVSKPLVVLNLLQSLLAILLGNVVYFLLLPQLPLAAHHRPHHIDLGMVLDFWICLVIYGTIRSVRKWR